MFVHRLTVSNPLESKLSLIFASVSTRTCSLFSLGQSWSVGVYSESELPFRNTDLQVPVAVSLRKIQKLIVNWLYAKLSKLIWTLLLLSNLAEYPLPPESC